MIKLPTPLTFIEYAKGHIYTRFFAPIASLFGFSDIIRTAVSRSDFPWLLSAAAGFFVTFLVYNFLRLKQTTLLPKNAIKSFYPFHSTLSEQQREKLRIARPSQVKKLADAVENNENIHTILSGNSGVGKSTLIELYLSHDEPGVSKDVFKGVVSSVLDLPHFVLKSSISTRPLSIQNSLDSLTKLSRASTVDANSLSACLIALLETARDSIYKEQDAVFIFDQAERLISTISQLSPSEAEVVYSFLNALARADWARVVFVCRSDQLSTLLEKLPSNAFDIIFITSIGDDGSDAATEDLRRKFVDVCKSAQSARAVESLLWRNSAANTFIVSLAGYIIESTSVRRILKLKTGIESETGPIILEEYIRLLGDEYSYLQKEYQSRADIETILFGLALYNHRTNLPCSIEMLTRLTHLPITISTPAIEYLLSRGVIEQESGRDDLLRLAHDLIADHLLRREHSMLGLEHAHAMQQIMDQKMSSDELIEVKEETNPFYSAAVHLKLSVAAALLWVAALIYGARIAFPDFSYSLLKPVNDKLDSFLPGIVSHNPRDWWLFIPIALTQYIWVLFMYGLDEGFFRYVTEREHRPWMRWIIHVSGPLGAAMGFALSFAPALFIIPIVVPGLILASAYLFLWITRPKQKLVDKYFRQLGQATAMNMAIALTICWGLSEIIMRRPEEWHWANAVSIILVCGLFCYFAYAMSGQGSRRGRMSMIAVYDAGSHAAQ